MGEKKLNRRDFLKATAVTTVVTGSVLAGKELIDHSAREEKAPEVEPIQPATQISCLDYINQFKKNS